MKPPSLSFSVLGVAVPFDRVSPANRHGNVFEPKAYRNWKQRVADVALAEARRAGWATAVGPVRVDVEVVLVRRPTKRPVPGRAHPVAGKGVGDLDNLCKGALDGCQRAGVFADDVQVVELSSRKRWQRKDEDFAGAVVRVELVT